MYLKLFDIAGFAILGWALLIFLPGWSVTRRIASSAVFPVFLATLYVIGVVGVLQTLGFGVMRDFGNSQGVLKLLARQDLAMVAWIHLLTFDQVVGLWIYRENMQHRYVPLPVQSIILFATLMFGPVGFLLFYIAIVIRRRNVDVMRVPLAQSTMTTPRTDNAAVALFRDAGALLRRAYAREPLMFRLGFAGIGLGLALIALMLIQGRTILPEGDLTKPITFDLAVGIYICTLALIVPFAEFSEKGARRWRWWTVAMATYGYVLETGQTLRGIDPRFTRHGTALDHIGGGVFLLTALTLVALFTIMAARFRRSPKNDDAMRLALQYAVGATFFAFGAGIWMAAVQGRVAGQHGNILPLHAIGFHALQAIPLIALLTRNRMNAQQTRLLIHFAGGAWLIACAGIAVQTAMGNSVFDATPATVITALALASWTAIALYSAALTRPAAAPAASYSPQSVGV